MNISTVRLDIIPLSFNQLKAMVRSRAELETLLGLKVSGEKLSTDYVEELQESLRTNQHAWQNNSKDYLFFTLWVMVDKQSKTLVGQFTFNGKPTPRGEVEVFFSVDPCHRRKGFGCEAMEGILGWAYKTDLFKVILIEADFYNKAAMASLRKLKFKPVPSDDEETESTKYYKTVCKAKKDDNLDFDSFKDCCIE